MSLPAVEEEKVRKLMADLHRKYLNLHIKNWAEYDREVLLPFTEGTLKEYKTSVSKAVNNTLRTVELGIIELLAADLQSVKQHINLNVRVSSNSRRCVSVSLTGEFKSCPIAEHLGTR